MQKKGELTLFSIASSYKPHAIEKRRRVARFCVSPVNLVLSLSPPKVKPGKCYKGVPIHLFYHSSTEAVILRIIFWCSRAIISCTFSSVLVEMRIRL